MNAFDVPLNFGENLIYTCQVRFASQTAFSNFCSNQQWNTLRLYNQIQDIQYLGIFGNSIPTNQNDWYKVLLDLDLTKFTFANNVCTFPSTIVLDIIYSKAGITANPQKYIVSAKFSALSSSYTYQSAIDAKLIVNYIDLDIKVYDQPLPTPSILPRLPSDIADPFVKG
jgi:hypothetical protein